MNVPDRSAEIALAVERLRRGQVVAFPTETVYGLGADALDDAAARSVFALKGRPGNNPLIVHVASVAMAREVTSQWPDAAQRLAERFWPGPLTIVLPKASAVPGIVTGGGDTVAVRQPDHPLALELLEAFGGPLVGPSANRSGMVSPTTAEHVRASFDERDVMVLDGGPCERGIESTVISLVTAPARVLRLGWVSAEEIGAVLGGPVTAAAASESAEGSLPLPAPGMMTRHYAPAAPTTLLRAESELPARAGPGPIALITHVRHRAAPDDRWTVLQMPADAEGYAAALYATLRRADGAGPSAIFIDLPAAPGALWDAIRDRLSRAAAPHERG